MKPLLAWLGISVAAFCALWAGTHAYRSARPDLVLAVVDSSYETGRYAEAARAALARISRTRYATFALADSLTLLAGPGGPEALSAPVSYYGPRDLGALADAYAKLRSSLHPAKAYLITSAAAWPELGSPLGLKVLRIAP